MEKQVKQLKKISNSLGVGIRRKGKECYFDAENNEIYIERGLKGSELLITIAHEIAHALDFHKNYSSLETWWKNDYCKGEVVAWLYSIELLKSVGFTDWLEFRLVFSYGLYEAFEMCDWESEVDYEKALAGIKSRAA